MKELSVLSWTTKNVIEWAQKESVCNKIIYCIQCEEIDGKCLLAISENDIKYLKDTYGLTLGSAKRFWVAVRSFQKDNIPTLVYLGLISDTTNTNGAFHHHHSTPHVRSSHGSYTNFITSSEVNFHDFERISPPVSIDGRASCIKPEFFKTAISLGESIRTSIHRFVFVLKTHTYYVIRTKGDKTVNVLDEVFLRLIFEHFFIYSE
jgi:hypothetical protein